MEHPPMGYFDGRQLAAETVLGLLLLMLDPEKNRQLQKTLEKMAQDTLHEDHLPVEFRRGFSDCLKRLESYRTAPTSQE